MPWLTPFALGVIAAGLLVGLFRALEASRNANLPTDGLLERLESLEARETAREIAFVEIKDQVYRHLKRVQALKQHASEGPSTELERQAAVSAAIRSRRASRAQPMLPNLNGEGS